MKLIKPNFKILEQGYTLEDVYKHIELCGRTCYKSEDKITENSAKGFVERMVKSGHGAMLEHGTIYLIFHVKDPSIVGKEEYNNQQAKLNTLIQKYINNKYSIVKVNHYYDTAFITTNYRVLIENNWLDDLKYLCEPTSFHEKRITVKFTCDRGVTHEFVRHRVFSFAQESTRYCNYSKDKFGNELTFIIPPWCNIPDNPSNEEEKKIWFGEESSFEKMFMMHCLIAESHYNELIELQYKPQQARAVLPNAIKAELVMTGFVSDWNHFFDLRARGTTGAPHPQAKELAEPLMNEFISRGWISE